MPHMTGGGVWGYYADSEDSTVTEKMQAGISLNFTQQPLFSSPLDIGLAVLSLNHKDNSK